MEVGSRKCYVYGKKLIPLKKYFIRILFLLFFLFVSCPMAQGRLTDGRLVWWTGTLKKWSDGPIIKRRQSYRSSLDGVMPEKRWALPKISDVPPWLIFHLRWLRLGSTRSFIETRIGIWSQLTQLTWVSFNRFFIWFTREENRTLLVAPLVIYSN